MSRSAYHKERYNLFRNPLPLELFCNGCGELFKPIRRGHHFCSRSCRQRVVMRARRAHGRVNGDGAAF